MRALSPIRSVSPVKPKITFKYQNSPLRQQNQQRKPTTKASQSQLTFKAKPPAKLPATTTAKSQSTITANSQGTINLNSQNQSSTYSKTSHKNKNNIVDVGCHGCHGCGKKSSYRLRSTDQIKYCSVCAINQVKLGVEVVKIEEKVSTVNAGSGQKRCVSEKENYPTAQPQRKASTETPLADEKSKQKQEFQTFRQQLQSQQKQLLKLLALLQEETYSQASIRQSYKEKKLQLKKHYQTIKDVIKVSIERDLAELNSKQKQRLAEISSKKKDVIEEVRKISAIKKSQLHHPLSSNLRACCCQDNCQESQSQITDFFQKWRKNGRSLKNNAFSSDISFSSIQRTNCQDATVHQPYKFQEEQLITQKEYLYQPELYMMTTKPELKGGRELIFSFEQK